MTTKDKLKCTACEKEEAQLIITIQNKDPKSPLPYFRVGLGLRCQSLTDSLVQDFNEFRKKNGLKKIPIPTKTRIPKRRLPEINEKQQRKLIMQILSPKISELMGLESIDLYLTRRFKAALCLKATGKDLKTLNEFSRISLDDLGQVEALVQRRITAIKSGKKVSSIGPLVDKPVNKHRARNKDDGLFL